MNVLITSGGTKIPIDGLRSITNKSNGTFGSKLTEVYLRNSEYDLTFLMAKRSEWESQSAFTWLNSFS